MTPGTILIMVVAILALAFVLVRGLSGQNYAPAATESVQQSSDLDGDLDTLDSINVDSLDSGLNELNDEVRGY